MRRFLNTFWPLSVIALISLIPLLWYKPDTIGLGHDMGWSLVPVDKFMERFYTWSRSGFGVDNSLDLGTFSFYAIEAAFSLIGFSIFWVQKLTYMFWFFAMGAAAYYFATTFYKGKYSQLVGLLTTTFYVLNHYTLQSWTIAEMSKYSAMTLFPILLANLWQVIDRKYSLFKTAIITGLFSIVFNGGGGSGIPLYGGILIGVLTLFFYKLFVERQSFFRLLKIFFVFFLAIFLANLYWIIPLFDVVNTQYSPFAASGGPEVTVGWTNVVSKNASILNLLRLQGFSSWYDLATHPYAFTFLDNPFLIFASVVTPIIVFLSIFTTRTVAEQKRILFLYILLLVSVVFTAGTHPPFGFIYEWLMTHVFGFAIFRTAFYKFGYALWFSYAFLFGFTIMRIFEFFKNKYIVFLGFLLAIVFLCAYNYPFFTGSFFNFDLPFKTMINVPDYIFTAKDYMRSFPESSRTFLVPPPSPTNGQSDVYEFGYFSRTPLLFQLTQKSIVTNLEINNGGQEKLTEELYASILQGDSKTSENLINNLGVTEILVRRDVILNNAKYKIIPPEKYIKNLEQFKWLKKTKTFGKWDFYSVVKPKGQFQVYVPDIFVGDLSEYQSYTQMDLLNKIFILPNDRDLFPAVNGLLIKGTCLDCSTDEKKDQLEFDIRLLPTSPMYVFVRLKEDSILKSSMGDKELYTRLLGVYTKKRAFELQELAVRSNNSTDNKVDQRKLIKTVSYYINQLTEFRARYSALSGISKLKISKEVVDSLTSQLNSLKIVEEKGLVGEIQNLYDFLRLEAIDFLHNGDLYKYQNLRDEYYSSTITIPESGMYTLYAKNSATNSALLDGEEVELKQERYILTGEHEVDLAKQQATVFKSGNDIVLAKDKSLVSISLDKLLPLKRYRVAFKIETPGNFPVYVYVVDSDGKVLGWTERQEILKKEVTLSFATPSYMRSSYKLVLVAGSVLNSGNLVSIKDLSVDDVSFPELFAIQQKNILSSGKPPGIQWQYLSPTSYRVKISKAEAPFVLIFAQSFSPFWDMSLDNGQGVGRHFMVNNSFNGWYIDAKGEYTVNIRFKFQEKYVVGLVLSFIFILTSGIFLVFTALKQNHE